MYFMRVRSPKVVAFEAPVRNGDTTLSRVIWAINKTIVACRMATELVMFSCSVKFHM